MEREMIEQADGFKITLRLNDWQDNFGDCAICGGAEDYLDGSGFYYFVEGTNSGVCEKCVKKHAPEIVKIRKEALLFAKREIKRALEYSKTQFAYSDLRGVAGMRVEQQIFRDRISKW